MGVLLAPAVQFLIPGLSTAAATTIANVGLYVGLTAAQYAIQASQQPPQPKTGTKLTIAFGGDVEQSIIIGAGETAGSLVYAGSWQVDGKTPNGMLVQVVCVSDMPITGPTFSSRVWINNQPETVDWSDTSSERGCPVTSKRRNGNDSMWLKFLDGTQTEADPYLLSKFGDAEKPWKDTMIGRGRALLIITTRYNKKEPEGLPQVRLPYRGITLYNPKKDSTNGGSGSHRWGNRNTYEWDDNAALAVYNWERGIYYGNEWMAGGRNLPAYLLDKDSFFSAITEANDDIDLKHGGTEKRYRVGGEISLAAAGYDTLDLLRTACNGRLSEEAGLLYLECGGIGAADYSITDDDIIVTQPQQSTSCKSLSLRVNTITGTYSEPSNGGAVKALRPRSDDAYIAEDAGQVLKLNVPLKLVRSNTQGQRILNYMLKDSRRNRTHTIVLPPAFLGLRPGRVINWTSDRYQYSNKKFIAGDVKRMPSGLVVTTLREADPSDNDWDTLKEDDFVAGVYGREPEISQFLDFTAEAFPIKNNAGKTKKAGIRVLFTLDDDDVDIKRISAKVRLKDTQELVDHDTVDAEEGDNEIIFEKGIVRSERYQVACKIIPESGRDTDYGDWQDVTAPDAWFDDDDLDQTAPDTLAAPSLSTLTADIDKDGVVDTGLTVSITPAGTGRTAKKYFYEIFRRRDTKGTDGNNITGYTLCDSFTIHATSKQLKLNANYFYKARVTPISANDVAGTPSPYISVGVQPLQYLATIPQPSAPTVTIKANGFHIVAEKGNFGNWKETILFANGDEIDRKRGTVFNDTRARSAGDSITYTLQFVDSQDRVGLVSAGTAKVYRLVQDADIDQTSPNAPGTPTLTTVTADIDRDGTLDNGLTVTFTAPATGRTPKKYLVEIYRSTSIGTSGSLSGYSLWKDFTTHKLSTNFRANGRYYHKCVVTPISPNDVLGTPSAATTIGVQPAAKASGPADPSYFDVTRSGAFLSFNWSRSTDPDYSHSRIYYGTGSLASAIAGGTYYETSGTVFSITGWRDGFAYNFWVIHYDASGGQSNALAYAGNPFTFGPLFNIKSNTGSIALSAGVATAVSTSDAVYHQGARGVRIDFQFINSDASFGRNFDIEIYNDASLIKSFPTALVPQNSLCTVSWVEDAPTGGSSVYTVKLTCPSATTVSARQLICTVL